FALTPHGGVFQQKRLRGGAPELPPAPLQGTEREPPRPAERRDAGMFRVPPGRRDDDARRPPGPYAETIRRGGEEQLPQPRVALRLGQVPPVEQPSERASGQSSRPQRPEFVERDRRPRPGAREREDQVAARTEIPTLEPNGGLVPVDLRLGDPGDVEQPDEPVAPMQRRVQAEVCDLLAGRERRTGNASQLRRHGRLPELVGPHPQRAAEPG